MSQIHAVGLDLRKVRELVEPVLHDRLSAFHPTDLRIAEEDDFDGYPVIRMSVHVDGKVPTSVLTEAINALHDGLQGAGDTRYVYFSTRRDEDDQIVNDIEE